MKHYSYGLLFLWFSLTCCGQQTDRQDTPAGASVASLLTANGIIDANGRQLMSRFRPPVGYDRKPAGDGTFITFLRNLPLKPAGTKVRYFNGEIKNDEVYDAVVDMEITADDLQQCADAAIRLRAEYLYSVRAFDKISFSLTNGFWVDYTKWRSGYRVLVDGNKTSWQLTAPPSDSYAEFRKYLDFVFIYAGTLSLSQTMLKKQVRDIAAGDVFVQGGSPGHAVMVVDIAENKKGEKIFLLAQSYMPAQEIQILKNRNDTKLGPWYNAEIFDKLYTPQWTFDVSHLRTWY